MGLLHFNWHSRIVFNGKRRSTFCEVLVLESDDMIVKECMSFLMSVPHFTVTAVQLTLASNNGPVCVHVRVCVGH